MPSPFDDIFGSNGPQWTRDQIVTRIRREAQQQGVDPEVALAVATQESALTPDAVGDNGHARGLFQLQPGAARDVGIDPRWRDDPGLNIYGGVRYLKLKLDQSKGNVEEALRRYNGGGDPQYVAHVMRHLPGPSRGVLGRVAALVGPASAEAAPPQQASSSAVWEDIFGAQAAPQAPTPPTARSTPEEDAAYRQWAAKQAPEGTQPPAPVSQATPTPVTPPGANQGPAAPSAALERFRALPSIQQLTPADRQARARDFQALRPDLQEEFLRSEEPPSQMTIDIEKPSPPQGRQGTRLPPAGSDDDAIITALGYDPALIKQAKLYQPGAFSGRLTDPHSTLATVMNSPLGGVLRGLRDPAAGALQLGVRGLRQVGILTDADVAYTEAIEKLAEADYQQNVRQGEKIDPATGQPGLLSDPSRLVGQAVAMPVPAGAPTTLAKTALRGAVTGAGMALAQPVQTTSPVPGGADDRFWAQKGEQVATGGVLGSVLGPVAEKVVAPAITKVWNWGRGVMEPAYRELVELSDRFGVRLSTGDVTRGAIAPKVETALEQVPVVGAGGFRQAQQREGAAAGAGMREGTQQALRQTPYRDLPTVERLANQGNKEAQMLLEEVQAAGDDWTRVVQASGKLNLFLDRQRATALYQKVDDLAAPLGHMQVDRTLARIDTLRREVADDVLPTPEVKREITGALGRVREELSPTQTVQPSMGVRDPVTGTLRGQPVTETTHLPDTTYGRMRQLRSRLGDLQREAAEPRVAKALGQVKTALEQDMATFVEKAGVPELRQAQREADTFYRTRVVPYREGMLARATQADLPDEIYDKFVRQGADRAQFFYKGLDQKGQAAVRAGMVEDAYQQATAGDRDLFSPAKFATALQRIQDATGVFFKGQPQWEIDGFRRLMRHAERAGQYAENPPTGQRLIPWLTGGAFLTGGASLPQIAAAGGTIYGMRLLFMTPQGRNFLLAAHSLEPGSPAMQRLVDRYTRQVPRVIESWTAARQGQGRVPRLPAPARR